MALTIDPLEFMPNIAPAFNLAPTAIIRSWIIEACRKFCWESLLWREQVDPVSVVAAQAFYDLTDDAIVLEGTSTQVNSIADIVSLEHIELAQIDLETSSERYLDENERGWRQRVESRPRRFIMDAKRQLRLVYIPTQAIADGLDMWLTLMPARSATLIEQFIYDDYRLAIENCAMAFMLEMPGVPWSDPKGALFYWTKWEMYMEDATDKKTSGYTDHQASYYFQPDHRSASGGV
ncbi:MAG: hypothetical protein JRI94_00455, partial [Deltaproteobacteria bacterium]|nr:hypothetical protein [Deltaproteobacteria bacterium]MBW2032054.1 hypothetical protein [Deltaproteobacteria bacterium]